MSNLPDRLPEHRAADVDRDAVAGDLRDAFGEGRLSQDEYQQRLDAVWESRTFGELERITADLPQPRTRRSQEQALEKKKSSNADGWYEWRGWAGTAVLLIGIWGITSAFAGQLLPFWPIFPVGIWGLILIAGMFWGDDDDEAPDKS